MPAVTDHIPSSRVLLKASWEACDKFGFDRWENEHFDIIENVVSIRNDGVTITLATTRSIEAFNRGEPNGGRRTIEIPSQYVESYTVLNNDQEEL